MMTSENIIHPTAIVGPNVTLGTGNYIGPYCVLSGEIEIGDNNKFISHVSVGSPPEHRGFPMDPSSFESIGKITIGSNNTFFEFVIINHPFKDLTAIGSNCFILGHVYLPHDCVLEDGVTIANGCTIGGHSILMKGCNLGFSVSVHQFSTIGPYSMVGMGSIVLEDLPPYCVYVGTGPRRLRLNTVGLSRNGHDEATIGQLQQWVESNDKELPEIAALHDDISRYKKFSGRR
jgi:UDP-N-acetylglucosamine acyltransferase